MFSPEIVEFFGNLLAQVQIPAGAPDFEQQAAIVMQARTELAAAKAQNAHIDHIGAPGPPLPDPALRESVGR